LEYTCKRFGMINGSTSEGKVLVIKQGTQCGGKQGKMSVSALMPCLDCGQTAFVRFQRLKFVKYNKKAVLDDCATCEQLVGWCKKLWNAVPSFLFEIVFLQDQQLPEKRKNSGWRTMMAFYFWIFVMSRHYAVQYLCALSLFCLLYIIPTFVAQSGNAHDSQDLSIYAKV